MAAVKRSAVVVLLLAAASAEPLKSLGDTLTDEAIGLAGQGRMQEALERFFDAREAEPQDSRRWQNVGVTLMRMGHLEDARVLEAPRLAPGDAACVANLGATAALRNQLARHGGLAQIRGFLADDVAATLAGEMAASEPWSPVQGFSRFYQFHFLMLDSNADNYWKANATVLHAMHGLFNSRHLKAWAAELLSAPPDYFDASTTCHGTYYRPGDYTMSHSDGTNARKLSYVLHLTTDWDPKFGGDLVFLDPMYHIHPAFNAMSLFVTSDSTWHFVSPVAPQTPARFKRLAYSGWFNSNRPHLDDRGFEPKIEEGRPGPPRGEGPVVDGGRVLSFEAHNALADARWSHMRENGEAEAVGNETATAVAAAVAAAGAVAATTIGDPLLDGAALTAAGAGSADVGAALTAAGAGSAAGVVASFAAATTTAADVVTGATAAAPALAEATAPALADGVASAAATAARRPARDRRGREPDRDAAAPVAAEVATESAPAISEAATVAASAAAVAAAGTLDSVVVAGADTLKTGGAETVTKVAKGVSASGGAETATKVAKGFAASGGAETATKVAKSVAASGGAETVSRVVKGVAASGVADSSAVKVGAGVEALSGGAGADALAKVGAGVEALSESGTMVLSKLAPLAEPALGAAEGAGLAAGLAAAVVGTAEVLKQNPAPVIATGALLGLARWAATELTGEVTTADDPLKKGEKTRVLKMLAIDAKPEKKG
ncbi:hypothetical protein JL720_5494 [Aureococcus anophagefferens]|nr:hypothetical protein JL720_5494 [Aureococcus anophagefferens]